MTRPFLPARATTAAPVMAAAPRPTQAQRQMHSTAELMMLEALSGIRAEEIPALIANALVARFGAAQAERIGERIGSLACMKGRV